MLGLGAGIDYALLIVGRYREQLAAGDNVAAPRPRRQRDRRHVRRRGRRDRRGRDRRPARHRHPVRRPDGRRLGDRRRQRRGRRGHGAADPDGRVRPAAAPEEARARRALAGVRALGERITRRPWTAAAAGTLVLVAARHAGARPAPRQARRRQRRKGTTTRVAYDRLAEGFGVGFNGPLVLAATLPAGDDAASAQRTIAPRATPGVAVVRPPRSTRRRRGHADRDPEDLPAGPEDERPRHAPARRDAAPRRAATAASTSAARPRRSTTWRPRSPPGCRSSSRS